MAVDDFKVGDGHYALAYGEHVVGGILAGYDDSVPTAVKIKVLLGLGEWNAIKEASYDGAIILPANYTFHPGTLSTGKNDPLQGKDTRFPNDIYHSRIAYYSMTLPDGLGADERPDKLRVIAEGLKVPIYDENGAQVDYKYSTNPADVFADIVRRNSLRLGIPFSEQMDWLAYAEARARYNQTIIVDDGAHTPQDVAVANVASGSLGVGTWYYLVVATGTGERKSAPSEIRAVEAAASSKNNLSWTAVSGATGYRVYYSLNDPLNFTKYFTTTTNSYSHTTTTGALTGTPPTLPTGDWAKAVAEFQNHRAFTQAQIITGDALSAVMFDAASEWVRDGKKHRILLPNRSEISSALTLDNTTSESFEFKRRPLKERVNQITAFFRNLDYKMKPDQQSPANNFAAQSRVGIVNEEITLGSMNRSQMRRITRWRQKYAHDKSRQMRVSGQMADHLLVADLVDVVDRQGGHRDDADGSGAPVLSSLNGFTATQSGSSWSTVPSPIGASRALHVKTTGSANLLTFDIANFPTGPGAEILFYIKSAAINGEFAIGFEAAENTPIKRYASFRRGQVASTIPAFTTNVRLGAPPPNDSGWVPVRIKLDDISWIEGHTIDKVYIYTQAANEFYVSQFIYTEKTPRTYIVDEIQDRESDGNGERLLTLFEYYPDAYDVNDQFAVPLDTGGGSVGSTSIASASAAANDAGVGSRAWTSPGNLSTSNDVGSSSSVSALAVATTNYLKATGFGFAIPSNANVDGIKVEIERRRTNAGDVVTDHEVKLVKGGVISGNNKAATGTPWPNADAYAEYGGNLDNWGLTLTPADVNAADFGVALAATINATGTGDGGVFVDHVRITVYHSIGAPPPTLNSLNFAGTTVTGSFTVNGGTGTIRVLRKTGSGGTYAEIGTVSPESTSFTDNPELDGTYYYKLTQDGITNTSNEMSVVVTLPTGSAPSDLSGYRYEELMDEWYVSLSWTNNGGTGQNVIEQKIGSGSWFEIARVTSSEADYFNSAPDGNLFPSVQYRVYNTAISGYSNTIFA